MWEVYILGAISGIGGFSIIGRPSHMSGVSCIGNETSLFQCSHSIGSLTECPDSSIAGVICQGISYSMHVLGKYNI